MQDQERGYLLACQDILKAIDKLRWMEDGRGEWGAGATHAISEIKKEIKKLIPEDLRYKL